MVEALRSVLPPRLQHHLQSARELLYQHAAIPATTLPTTVDAVDRLLNGGLPRGQMVELVGHRSSGRFSTVLTLLADVTTAGEAAALVDLGDSLDPRHAETLGVALERLLWIRPRHLKQALVSAEMLLAVGFPLVVVDLGYPPIPGGRGPEAGWLRLTRTAESHGTALLVSSPYRASGMAAAGVVRSGRGRPLWSGSAGCLLLLGLSSRMTLEKLRGQHGTRSASLRLLLSEAAAFETSGDRRYRLGFATSEIPGASAGRSATPTPLWRGEHPETREVDRHLEAC